MDGTIETTDCNRFAANAIRGIGTPTFARDVLVGLSNIVPFDHLAAVRHRRGRPISLLSGRPEAHRRYLGGNYRRDPFYRAACLGLRPGLYRLTDFGYALTSYLSEYDLGPRIDDLGQPPTTGGERLREEIAFVLPAGGDLSIHFAMIRSDRYPRFTNTDLDRLRAVQSVLEAAIQRHGELQPWTDEPPAPVWPELTDRERQVAQELLAGLRGPEIAGALGISAGTVKVHRRNLYRKLGISSQAELFLLVGDHRS